MGGAEGFPRFGQGGAQACRVEGMKLNIAIVGAGMAGITAARTLKQAGHAVTVFEKSRGAGGRMATRETTHGTFDHGAQYFTVRDARFATALQQVPGTVAICRPWSANAVRVLDPNGRVFEAARQTGEAHFVPMPGMNALVRHWAEPLGDAVHLSTQVHRLAREPNGRWTLWANALVEGRLRDQAFAGFDRVLLAMPQAQTSALLQQAGSGAGLQALQDRLEGVDVAPCWTLMLAFPQASGLRNFGPQWNAARSTHHRVAWLARESSKPGRGTLERWTVQASAEWSQEHLEDPEGRVTPKLVRAFSELTGIRVEPAFALAHRWRYAKTECPLGEPFLYDAGLGLGTCGDWHLGCRVEDAFVSGLSLALHLCEPA